MDSAPLYELSRFAIVGVLINAALYGAYLALTLLGMPYMASMSVVYVADENGNFSPVSQEVKHEPEADK